MSDTTPPKSGQEMFEEIGNDLETKDLIKDLLDTIIKTEPPSSIIIPQRKAVNLFERYISRLVSRDFSIKKTREYEDAFLDISRNSKDLEKKVLLSDRIKTGRETRDLLSGRGIESVYTLLAKEEALKNLREEYPDVDFYAEYTVKSDSAYEEKSRQISQYSLSNPEWIDPEHASFEFTASTDTEKFINKINDYFDSGQESYRNETSCPEVERYSINLTDSKYKSDLRELINSNTEKYQRQINFESLIIRISIEEEENGIRGRVMALAPPLFNYVDIENGLNPCVCEEILSDILEEECTYKVDSISKNKICAEIIENISSITILIGLKEALEEEVEDFDVIYTRSSEYFLAIFPETELTWGKFD